MALSMLRMDNEPLYAKTSEAIVRYINVQNLKPGDKLPSEAKLAELLGVSRSTIREGLRELELQRRVARIQGRGTIISHQLPAVTGLATLESLQAIAARQGWVCGTAELHVKEGRLPPDVADALTLRTGQKATEVTFVKTHDERPIWLSKTWIPTSLLKIEYIRSKVKTTIFELFGDQLPKADYAYSTVTAVAATAKEAKILRIHRRAPLVVLTETFYHAPNKPIFYSRNSMIPDEIILEINRRPEWGKI